jgi:hypothetical protein
MNPSHTYAIPTPTEALQRLIEDLHTAANFRRHVESDYPDDPRNAASATLAENLIRYVETLADSDERFVTVAGLMIDLPEDFPVLTGESSRLGFCGPWPDLDDALTYLIRVAVSDHQAFLAEQP